MARLGRLWRDTADESRLGEKLEAEEASGNICDLGTRHAGMTRTVLDVFASDLARVRSRRDRSRNITSSFVQARKTLE